MIADNPDDLELNRLLGLALLNADSASSAVWPLRKVAEHPQHSVTDLYALAQAYARGGAQKEAMEVNQEVLAVDPYHTGGLRLNMSLGSLLGRWPDVVESTEKLLEMTPEQPRIYLNRAEAFMNLEQLDEADEMLAHGLEILDRKPLGADLEFSFCQMSVKVAEKRNSDDGEIEDRWMFCLERTSNSAQALDGAIEFFDESEITQVSDQILEDALARAPRNLEIREKLATRLETRGEAEAAETLLLEATHRDGAGPQAWLALANLYREREDHASAVQAIEEILQVLPTVPVMTLAMYADDLIRAGEFEKAEEVLDLINRPEWVSLLRGRLLLEKGESQAAMDELQQGIRLWPGNGAARMLAGQAAERLGNFDLAILEYRDAVRSRAESTSAVYQLASLYAAEGRYEAALFPLNLRMSRNPDDARAGLEMVRMAIAGRNRPAAIGTMESLLKSGHEIESLQAEAMIAKADSGPAEAAQVLEEAGLDWTQSQHISTLQSLVGYWIESNDAARALTHTGPAMTANPTSSDFLALHAQALVANGRTEEALSTYEKALQFDATSHDALLGLGKLQAERGLVTEALALYDRAAQANPPHSVAAWSAIELLMAEQRETDITDRLEELLLADPKHAEAANLLSLRLLDDATELGRASELAQRAIRFRGGAPAYDTAGQVARANGEWDKAIHLFGRSLEMRPKSAATRIHLARALIESGQVERARKVLQVVLKSDELDQAEEANRVLAQLEKNQSGG